MAKKKRAKKKKKPEKREGNYDFTGSRNNRTKLTEAKVKSMRALFAQSANKGDTLTFLARRFKVSRNTIRNIVYGQTWKHI